ncbi:MAG: PAS domain S-box protein [Candidatus Methylomirabilales bacterium]
MASRDAQHNRRRKAVSRDTLLRRTRELRRRLAESEVRRDEAEQTLEAIRTGAVDAVLVSSPEGERIFTLHGAEQSYRLLVETVNAAAMTVALDGTVIYANGQAGRLLNLPLEQVIGAPLEQFVVPEDLEAFGDLFRDGRAGESAGELRLMTSGGPPLAVHLALRRLDGPDLKAVCVVAADLTERKQAEEALRRANEELEARVAERTAVLRASEAKFAALFQGSPVGITLAAADGRLLEVNDTVLAMFGYDASEVIGRTVEELRAWADPAQRGVLMQHAKAAGLVRGFEARLRRKSGELFPALVSAQLLTLRGEPVLVSGVVDITDRKRIEEAFRESEQRLALAQRAGRIGTFDWEVGTTRGVVTAGMESVYGERPGGITDSYEDWRRRVHPEDIARVEQTIADALAGKADYDAEYRILWPDGSLHWVGARGEVIRDERGRPHRLIGVNMDITGRKVAEERLRESEARFRSLYAHSGDAILLSTPDGRILGANPAACRLFGCTEEEIARGGRAALIDPADSRHARAQETRVRTGFFAAELTLRRADGTRFPADVTSAVYLDHTGERRTSMIIRDITRRKQAEARLHEALADKDALLREVHHRVKNNLQMLCDLMYLQMEAMDDPAEHPDLQDAYTRVYAIARLHEQLYKSMQSGRVQLGEYLGRLVGGFADLYPNVALALEAGADDLALDLDRAIHVGLIVNELITNAVKHAFPKGQPGEVVVRLGTEADRVRLQVQDNGRGLWPGLDLEHAKSLGLRTIYILSRRLEADVKIENDGGMSFTLAFPMHAEPPVEPRPDALL